MPVPVGPRLTVSEFIGRAEDQGCTVQMSRAAIGTPNGLRHVRYLYNPTTGGRYPLDERRRDVTRV
jgi:hypothetical protein